MRRVVVLALLALALPIAVWADGINITNQGGTVAITGMAGTERPRDDRRVNYFFEGIGNDSWNNQTGHLGLCQLLDRHSR